MPVRPGTVAVRVRDLCRWWLRPIGRSGLVTGLGRRALLLRGIAALLFDAEIKDLGPGAIAFGDIVFTVRVVGCPPGILPGVNFAIGC